MDNNSDDRQPTERPKVGSLEWARQLASDSVRAGEAETTGKPTERRVGERRKLLPKISTTGRLWRDSQGFWNQERRQADRRAAPVFTGEGVQEWLAQHRIEFLEGTVELTNIRGERLRDVPYLNEDKMLDAYATHCTALANDCLNAAAKAGLKLVKQPLAEFADIPLGESFEFENVKAAELERQVTELQNKIKQLEGGIDKRTRY